MFDILFCKFIHNDPIILANLFLYQVGKDQTYAKININTANESVLQTLPGIGPVLSERIIKYRNQNGFFGSIDDIKNVSGIGEKKFEGIKDLICTQ